MEAGWGSTKTVHCIKDEQVRDYIAGDKSEKRLEKAEIDAVARAFSALARMERGFDG